jgi:hypothetical protein
VLGLTACGGGGGGSRASSQLVPVVDATPFASSGPVTYMQSSGPLSITGTIVSGSKSAFVAVISGAAQPASGFAFDSLTVSTSASVQSSLRRPAALPMPVARHANAPEAFPADSSALLRALDSTRVAAATVAPARSRSSVVPANAAPGTQIGVWVQQGGYGSRTYAQVPATLAVQTAHGNIWIDNSVLSSIGPGAAQIGADFENAYASDVAHFAAPDYTPGAPALQPQYASCNGTGGQQGTAPAYIAEPADRRIDVMVVNSATLGGYGGYFSAANLMTQGALNCLNAGYRSNEAPFIYVAWVQNFGSSFNLQEDLVRSTAHEFQHLINFVNHGILAAGASSPSFNGNESQYLNEGLSMLAQDLAVQRLFGSQGVQFDAADSLPRAGAYLADPSAFSITGFSGIDQPAWGGNGSSAQNNCSGGCYGGAYLFARYLRDRFGGDTFTHAIESSGQTGSANLQAVTGEGAGELVGDFALAIAANTLGVSPADPRFNMGTLNLTATYADQLGGSTTLQGASASPLSGSSASVRAPLGGFAFVSAASVPASGMSVQVMDQAAVSGFSLLGGLAQH